MLSICGEWHISHIHVQNTSWKVRAYDIYARVVDVSEIERVRFLMQKERARKYRTSTFHVAFVYYIHSASFSYVFQIFCEMTKKNCV